MARHYFLPLIERLKIVDKELRTLRLGRHLTPPQRVLIEKVEEQMTDGVPVRAIILKARQMGFSTIVEAMMFQSCFTLPGLKGLVVAHEAPSAAALLGMSHHYWETFWAADSYELKSKAANRLAWDMPNARQSSMTVRTAKNIKGGRGLTAHFLHNSEAAFYDRPEEFMTSMAQSLPRTPMSFQFIESTANGVGNWFHKFWLAAKAGDVAHVPVFFGWWEHPHYTADRIGLGHLADRPLTDTDDEEKLVWRFLTSKGLDDRDAKSRLIWRRQILNTECHGDIAMLHQEYPLTDEEAFIATGRNVFNLKHLRRIYKPEPGRRGRLMRDGSRVRFFEDDSGPWVIYREPRRDSWYTIGGDPSKAAQYGDYACAQVIDRRSWEQVAVFRERGTNPATFAQEMLKAGLYFNEALLAPETNMSGGAVAEILRTNYSNVWYHKKANRVPGQMDNTVGWVSGKQTKAEAIQNLQKAVLDAASDDMQAIGRGMVLHDHATYNEMMGYTQNENGDYENSIAENVHHDDTVMALAIAITVTMYEAAMMIQQPTPGMPKPGAGMVAPRVTAAQREDMEAAASVGAATEVEVLETPTGYAMPATHSEPMWEDEIDVYDDEGDWI